MKCKSSFLFCLFLLLTACAKQAGSDPVEATVISRQTEAAIATQVEGTLAASQMVLDLENIQTVSMRFEATLESDEPFPSGMTIGSFLGGEAIFSSRGEGLSPDFYVNYRFSTFTEDTSILMTKGNTYYRNSRFNPEWEHFESNNLMFLIGVTYSNNPLGLNLQQFTPHLVGFSINEDMRDWQRVGIEMIDGRETVRYATTTAPNYEFIRDSRGIVMIERAAYDFWITTDDRRPRRLTAAITWSMADEEYELTLTTDLFGYNDPVSIPSPN